MDVISSSRQVGVPATLKTILQDLASVRRPHLLRGVACWISQTLLFRFSVSDFL